MRRNNTSISCISCQIVLNQVPANVVYEDKKSMAFLDIHPQTRGHMQLIPKKHYQWVYEVPFMSELFSTAQMITRGIIPALNASHVQYATFGHEVKHAHIWIVPQYDHTVSIHEGKSASKNSI